MNKKSFSAKKKLLLATNAILLFIIAFQIGSRLAKAQIIYFDEPQSTDANNSSGLQFNNILNKSDTSKLISAPTTAQYQEFKDQISSVITPENPKPGQKVTISINTYSFDINSSEITWKVDGKEIRKGLGVKDFSFSNGKAGVATKIDVEIDPRDRPILTKTFTFKSGEVDLLWQSDVYTHPFYKGKKLYTPEATLVFVAMPRNSTGFIDTNNTVFNWKINETNYADKSGFGRNSYLFEGPIISRPVQVAVEVYAPSKDGSSKKETATTELTVQPKSSGLLFYENNPLYGVLFNKALRGTLNIESEEMGVSAYPYFQTTKSKNSDILYRWVIDGYPVSIAENQNSITLKKVQAESGQSVIASKAFNPFKILQTAQTSFTLKFDSSTKNNTLNNEFGN